MEGSKITAIKDLLNRRHALSGAHFLSSPFPAAPSASPSGNSKTLKPTSSAYKVLKSLVKPSLIVGTLNLPASSGDQTPPSPPCGRNCFSFSDDSGSICCDVLDFDVRMLGKEILVISWNFIPFTHPGGFLEIINWKFPADSAASSENCSMVLGSVKPGNDVVKACHSVHGLLQSVSPVSVVPCTIGGNKNDSSQIVGDSKTLCGFIVQILSCRCKLCCSNDISAISYDFIRSCNQHSFKKEFFVYFVGLASSWHLAILKLIGNVISLSRLKKKLIYMGKKEKEIVFLTTDETCLRLPRLHYTGLSLESSVMAKSSFGVYTGVVRGIYVQGKLVEMDENVWLLLTDKLLILPHSIRVGAVIRVRNVHFVNPKFSWRKVLILGACYKTSISMVSFSPLETGCHQVLQSPSLLGKYIGSLALPARLWVLLIVQCFRKKFVGSFSEKEILGSNHKEGVAQKYATSILSTSVIHPSQRGVFTEFCKHASCGCSRELSCPTLSLVVPLVIFVKNCEMLWTKFVLSIIDATNQTGYCSREHKSHGSKVRKMFPSEGSGISLLGSLKISPTTGRLQLIDATCSIDVVVPDLPSHWNINDIFEVFDYTIVVEGEPERICHLQMVDEDALSCRNIFQCKLSETDKNVDIYVYFLWRNAICRIAPVSSCSSKGYMELDSGIFHLFLLTHRFPLRPKISGDPLVSNGASFFAEAMILPWDVYLPSNDNGTLLTGIPVEKRKRCCLEDEFPNKRRDVHFSSTLFHTLGSTSHSMSGGLEMRSCSKLQGLCKSLNNVKVNQQLTSTTPVEIQSLVTVRSAQGQCTRSPGILFTTKTNGEAGSHCLAIGRKVLLEFNFETILKYKLLKIGSCYIIKHCGEESFCDFKDIKYERKIVINPDMHFWSLSFFSEEDVSNVDPSQDHSSDYCKSMDDSSENCIQRRLVFHSCTKIYHDCLADVNLWISSEAIRLFNSSIQPLKEVVNTSLLLLDDIPSVCDPVGSRRIVFGLEQPCGSSNAGGRLPEGNLVTICGTVVALQWYGAISKSQCHMGAGTVHQLKSYQEGREVISLHISTGADIVKIEGVLCKVDYPVGLGLGSNATFHRILGVSGKNHLMLTPVSFITVNHISEFKKGLADQIQSSENTFPKAIYDKIQCSENTLRRICCKVVAVHTVILANASIPFARLILDDGSLSYCCWTYGESAAKLLRLHKKKSFMPHQRWWYELEWSEKDELYKDVSLHLKEILEKHQTVTMKNSGSFFDSFCQDLQLYGGSDDVINPSDEELLKFIILNACSGPLWRVTGHTMDSSHVIELETCLRDDQPILHSMPNIWVTEVSELDMLAEARDILDSL